MGFAASASCLIGVLMDLYPSYKASMTSFTETFVGLGYLIGWWSILKIYCLLPHFSQHPGPPFGSILYEWAGFGVPYYGLGGFILIVTFSLMILIPKQKSTQVADTSEEKEESRALNLSDIIKVWDVASCLSSLSPLPNLLFSRHCSPFHSLTTPYSTPAVGMRLLGNHTWESLRWLQLSTKLAQPSSLLAFPICLLHFLLELWVKNNLLPQEEFNLKFSFDKFLYFRSAIEFGSPH